jgi:hypothetical protein
MEGRYTAALHKYLGKDVGHVIEKDMVVRSLSDFTSGIPLHEFCERELPDCEDRTMLDLEGRMMGGGSQQSLEAWQKLCPSCDAVLHRRTKTCKGCGAQTYQTHLDIAKPTVTDENDLFEVHSIVASREDEEGLFYQVRCKSKYAADSYSWEPAENCKGCSEAIEAFKKRKQHRRATAKAAKASDAGEYSFKCPAEVRNLTSVPLFNQVLSAVPIMQVVAPGAVANISASSERARRAAVIRWSSKCDTGLNTSVQCSTTTNRVESFIVAGAPEPAPSQESNGTIGKLLHAQSQVSPGRRSMPRNKVKGLVMAGTSKAATFKERKYSFNEFIIWCTAFDNHEITMPQYKKLYDRGHVRVPPSMISQYVYGLREKPRKLRSGRPAKKAKKTADDRPFKIAPRAYLTMTSFPRKGPEPSTVITRPEQEFIIAWVTMAHLRNKPLSKQDVMAWANRVAEIKGKREADADLRGW